MATNSSDVLPPDTSTSLSGRSLRSTDHTSSKSASKKKSDAMKPEKTATKRPRDKPEDETKQTPSKKLVESTNKKSGEMSNHKNSAKAATTPKLNGVKKPNAKKSSKSPKPENGLYDSDDFQDEERQIAPLTHVHVARGAFGDMKFTKAQDQSDESPKYLSLAKSADKRQKQSFKSPAEVSKPSSLTPSQTSKEKAAKAGASTYPKSTPSSAGHRDSIGLSSSEKLSGSSKRSIGIDESGSKKTGKKSNAGDTQSSPLLFSDVEQKVCDDFDAEDFLADRSKKVDSIVSSPKVASLSPSYKIPKKGRPKTLTKVVPDGEEQPSDAAAMSSGDDEPLLVAASQRKRAHSPAANQEPDMWQPPVDRPRSTPVAKKKRASDKLTPKPRKPHLEKLTPDEQLERDKASQASHHWLPGTRILCRWQDRCFYPGHIVFDLGFGRYTVRYNDGVIRDLPAPDIVPVASLKQGNQLMVKQTDNPREGDILMPVKILNPPSITNSQEWFAGIFEVENTETDSKEKVAWDKFLIDTDQAKDYVTRQAMINRAAQEVIEDNISDSRVRRNRGQKPQTFDEDEEEEKEEDDLESPRQIQVRTPKRTPKTPKAASRSAAKTREYRKRQPRVRENYDFGMNEPALQGVLNEDTDDDEEREPLFQGLSFVLTSANRARPPNECSEEERPLIQFNKKHVRQMIDEYGGQVVDDFMMLADTQSCFLIADQFYRTHKYLSALARAVPCVSHMWIHDCFQAGVLLPHKDYMLPAGQSLETSKIVEWHNKCPTLLADKKIFVYTENRPTNPGALDFVQIWAPLVKCMGAQLLEELPAGEEEGARVDVLLTDISCPNSVLSQATALGANAVSSEWLIQAIIVGRTPEPDAHLKYRYDFVERPEQPPPAPEPTADTDANAAPAVD